MFQPPADKEKTPPTMPPDASGSQRRPGRLGPLLSMFEPPREPTTLTTTSDTSSPQVAPRKLGDRASKFETPPPETPKAPATDSGRGRGGARGNGTRVSALRNSMAITGDGKGMRLVLPPAPTEPMSLHSDDTGLTIEPASDSAPNTTNTSTTNGPVVLPPPAELQATVGVFDSPALPNKTPSPWPASNPASGTAIPSPSATPSPDDTSLFHTKDDTSPHDDLSTSSAFSSETNQTQTSPLGPTHSVRYASTDPGPTSEAREQAIHSQLLQAIELAYQHYSGHVRNETLHVRYINRILVDEQYFGLFHSLLHDAEGIKRADDKCVKVIRNSRNFSDAVQNLSQFLHADDVSYGPYSFTAYLFDHLIELCGSNKHVNLSKQAQYSSDLITLLIASINSWAKVQKTAIPNASVMLNSSKPTEATDFQASRPTSVSALAPTTTASPTAPSTGTSISATMASPSPSPQPSVSLKSMPTPIQTAVGESQTPARPSITPKPTRPAPRPAQKSGIGTNSSTLLPAPASILPAPIPAPGSSNGIGTNSSTFLPAPASISSAKRGPAPTPPEKPKQWPTSSRPTSST